MQAFKIIKTDGTHYITDLAAGITLQQARDYFIGPVFTDEDSAGRETKWTVANVEHYNPETDAAAAAQLK